MEVHHPHPKLHGFKNWRVYVWEFLMLFLAVFCGFLAEFQLELSIERHREKEFIKSMIADAETDTSRFQRAINLNIIRILKLDTLARKCFEYNKSIKNDQEIFKSFIECSRHPYFVSPAERTLSQLKNSGGMRLIKKENASNAIALYDEFSKKLLNQQSYYEQYLNKLLEQSMDIFNYRYFSKDPLEFSLIVDQDFKSNAKLLTGDKDKIFQFANRLILHKAILIFYVKRLKEGNRHAGRLIHELKKEYNLY